MSAIIYNPHAAWLIIGCAAMVLLVTFGGGLSQRLSLFNKKHHILEWENGSIYDWDDDDE